MSIRAVSIRARSRARPGPGPARAWSRPRGVQGGGASRKPRAPSEAARTRKHHLPEAARAKNGFDPLPSYHRTPYLLWKRANVPKVPSHVVRPSSTPLPPLPSMSAPGSRGSARRPRAHARRGRPWRPRPSALVLISNDEGENAKHRQHMLSSERCKRAVLLRKMCADM